MSWVVCLRDRLAHVNSFSEEVAAANSKSVIQEQVLSKLVIQEQVLQAAREAEGNNLRYLAGAC